MKPISILLVDDHTLFRSGLKSLLQRQSDFKIIGEATSGLEGIKLAHQLKPDVVLLDLDMPLMNGQQTLEQMLSSDKNLTILMLTVSEDAKDLATCMQLGARGYLLKNINIDFLLESIRKAVDGDSVLSPEMINKLIHQLRAAEPSKEAEKFNRLTPRETEILSWLAKGLSNKDIAIGMSLAESTVKVHVQNVLHKLELSSRVQAAVYALEYQNNHALTSKNHSS